jgi:hypothetical protein
MSRRAPGCAFGASAPLLDDSIRSWWFRDTSSAGNDARCRHAPHFLVNHYGRHWTPSNFGNMKPRRDSGNNARRAVPGVAAALLGATFAVVSGCAADKRAEAAPPRSILTDVVLTVENEETRPFVIYLRSDAWTDSLGQVPGNATRSFSVPSRAADSVSALRLEAREHRNLSIVRSHALTLASGHQVVWKLHPSKGSDVTLK